MRDDGVYLEYIEETIRRIENSTGMQRARFRDDLDVQDAVLRRMQTIAEATGNLSQDLKDRHTEIPWHQITGFRHRLVHAYLDVDIELVWEAIERLPELQRVIEVELERARDQDRANEVQAGAREREAAEREELESERER